MPYLKDLEVVLHIGLHKTATTYLQNVLAARRYDLVEHGLLYPNTGTDDGPPVKTRDGAQSGHSRFTYPRGRKELFDDLRHDIPPTASTVLVSSEDFTRPRITPAQHLERFSAFGKVTVVAVVRRQDEWIESYYKQVVDQYGNRETRSLADFVAQEGPALLDFHALLAPWRELVGPDAFHVLSYDDLPGGAALTRRVLEIAGFPVERLGEFPGVDVPRYDSIRAIDTLGMRLLNGYRLPERDTRNRIAREIYAAAPAGDLELMTAELRAGIQQLCAPVNERIEREWIGEPAPGFRFGAALTTSAAEPPSGPEMVAYVERVLALCEAGRPADAGVVPDTTAPRAADSVLSRQGLPGRDPVRPA